MYIVRVVYEDSIAGSSPAAIDFSQREPSPTDMNYIRKNAFRQAIDFSFLLLLFNSD